MVALSPPAPVNPTGQLAQFVPGYDPGPVIAAQEQSLQEYLNLPVREILARLGLPPLADGKHADEAPPPEAQPDGAPAPASPMDPSQLISPVTDALGTLGNGLFQGQDPTKMFDGISKAFDSTGGSLQQALGAVDGAWRGSSATAAKAKTAEAIANGAEVGAQSNGLRTSLATAAADVQQARVRLIEIISEFQATLAAIGPAIIFPWGWAAVIAAANKAVASAAEVMTELQSSLGAQAAEVSALGAPVAVTEAPSLAAAAAGPTSALSPALMSMAPQLLSAGIGAAASAAQAGVGAATSAAQANQSAEEKPNDPTAPVGSGPIGAMRPGAAAGGGPAGGGPSATPASRSISSSPMVQSEPTPTEAASTRAAMTGSRGVSGPGMMGGAPMGAYGARAGAENSHTSASFLHTTDQGGEIVGDLGTAAPPVLGEADPNEPPDVELRI